LREPLGAQVAGDRAEDAGPDRLVVLVDEDSRVGVEADVRPVLARHLFLGAHDDGLRDLALLHLGVRNRLFDRHDDDVADRGVLPLRATEHADAHDLLGTRVIGDVESGCRRNDGVDSPLSLLRPFDQFLDAPALVGRQRAALDDLHAIARLELVLLVVRLVLRTAGPVLGVLGIGDAAFDHHDARLVHLVARDDADHAALVDFVTGHFTSPRSLPGLLTSWRRALSFLAWLVARRTRAPLSRRPWCARARREPC